MSLFYKLSILMGVVVVASNYLVQFPIKYFGLSYEKELFVFKEETQLYDFLSKLSKSNKISSALNSYKKQLDHIKEFNSIIEKFFDNVLVNDENIKIRNNRIILLKNIKINFEMICKFQLIKN